ncbi:helix-turn-helix transcriptional regulator [Sphingomonas alpina]|uniref:YafY family transcriptional regulator n=1 Tax=Sphingomonas alpina TaxID=653931 RepID=A0A7H0LL69_9SPHN|nr:YafY family protein [Sphingomonas alpina]QNQ10422.1 YafY family transcriptional regulator [Sphingomonas alpina]
MSRSHRLFDLLQILRRHRGTVSGAVLAREADVSLRTIRRDIATLQAMGADIDAEAGVGYILRPGFLLPPLSFTQEELHALVVGAQWVSRQTDPALAHAVRNALAKIDGVLAPEMREALDDSSFYVGGTSTMAAGLDLAQCRRALREQRKMRIAYREEGVGMSERIVWPIMLGFAETERSIAGWCETNGDYHLFHGDRIVHAEVLAERYARDRRKLVKEWRASAQHPCARSSCS